MADGGAQAVTAATAERGLDMASPPLPEQDCPQMLQNVTVKSNERCART
jgi:hypothetical protein